MNGRSSDHSWTVQEAKGRLSEILRRARAGTPQRIGLHDPCYVVSERVWHAGASPRLGAWLVSSAPSGSDLMTPERGSARAVPFSDEATSADDA